MITREQARTAAEEFLRARGPLPGWDGIGSVVSPQEILARQSISTLSGHFPDTRWRTCWLISIRGAAGGVILVSDTTAEVEFAGSIKGTSSGPPIVDE
jgi:hypothetical protein